MDRFAWGMVFCLACAHGSSAQEVKRVGVGANGYVSEDQLAKLTYGPVINGLALGLHLPDTRVAAGDAVWAYFIVKNTQKQVHELDMRFDTVIGSQWDLINSCGITIRTLDDNHRQIAETNIRNKVWMCGKPLVYLPGEKHYVAALDLAAHVDLRPGHYEVSWRYSLKDVASNAVRFTVTAGRERPRAAKNPLIWTLWELDLNKSGNKKPPLADADRSLMVCCQHGLSAALGGGIGGRHVTNLEWLPDRDDLLTIAADWKLGEKFDRVTLRLTPRVGRESVTFHDLHVYLLAQGAETHSGPHEEMKRTGSDVLTIKDPHSIEFHLPAEWRAWREGTVPPATFQAAFLVTAAPIEPPGWWKPAMRELSKAGDSERIWNGLLKTRSQTLVWRKQ